MKIGLEIKNPKKAIRPSRNDVILFDGKEWYVTTKEELFKEFEGRLNAKEKELDDKIAECNQKILELKDLKKANAEQILKIASIVEEFISREGK